MKVISTLSRELKHLFHPDNSSDVFKNMLVLASGTGVAKVIAFLSVLVLTRLYTPHQFGLFSIFMSATLIATPLTTLRYSAALPLPRVEAVAVKLLVANLLLVLIISSIIGLLLEGFGKVIFSFFAAPTLYSIWPLLLISIMTAAFYEVLAAWATRIKAFKSIAHAEVAQSLLSAVLKISLTFTSMFRSGGLIYGHIIAQLVSCAMLFSNVYKKIRKTKQINVRSMLKILGLYRDFPSFRFPSQLLLMFSMQAPILFASAEYGTAVAGQLGLAMNAIGLPMMLIGQATSQAYYSEIARIGIVQPVLIYKISREVLLKMLLLGLIPAVSLMLGARWMFIFFFGERWEQAGVFASILAIYLLLQFAANPLANALNIFKRNDLFFYFNAIRTLMIVSVFALSHWMQWSAPHAILAYTLVLSVYYLSNAATIFRIIKHSTQQ